MLAEFLFSLTPRDQQAAMLEIVKTRVNASAAALTVDAEYVVPLEHILIVHNLWTTANPDLSNGVRSLQFMVFENEGQNPVIISQAISTTGAAGASGIVPAFNALANDTDVSWQWTGEIYLPPQSRLRARASFSGAAGLHSVSFDIIGILIPRGNVAL